MWTNERFIVGCLTLVLCCQWSMGHGSASDRTQLINDLLEGYSPKVNPDGVVLKVGLALICSRFDQQTKELTTSAWEKLSWQDSRLSWERSDYKEIESIHIPSQDIWTPDLKLYNSFASVETRDPTIAIVNYEGKVTWIPRVNYLTLCSPEESTGSGIDCQFKLGSWTYDDDTVKLELDSTGVDVYSYMNSTCPLKVESATATLRRQHYPCCEEAYSHVDIELVLKRQTGN